MNVLDYYNEGLNLIAQKDYDAAIEMCNTALAEYPDNSGILDRRASAYHYKGEIDKALADYTRVVDLYPQQSYGLDRRGSLYRQLGEYDKALADYTRMIDLDPQNRDGWNNRGNLYHELGQYDKAIADFTQCIPLSPDNYGTYWSNRGIAYREKGDLDAALADLNKSIECWGSEPSSWALTHRALVWKKKGDLDKALEDFAQASIYEPEDDFPCYHAGYIWFMRQDYDKAIEWFSKAIVARGDKADNWLARGVCYWNQCCQNKIGFWDEGGEAVDRADEDFTKAIECSPDMAAAYFSRGLLRCSKAQESNKLIKAIASAELTDEATRVLLQAQLEYVGGEDLVEPTNALWRGLRSNRDQLDVLMAQGAGLIGTKDAEEAIEDLSRAIALEPGNAEAYYQRGLAYALTGAVDKALADYEQTCDMDPSHDKAAEKRDELLESQK